MTEHNVELLIWLSAVTIIVVTYLIAKVFLRVFGDDDCHNCTPEFDQAAEEKREPRVRPVVRDLRK